MGIWNLPLASAPGNKVGLTTSRHHFFLWLSFKQIKNTGLIEFNHLWEIMGMFVNGFE
jgi:hypothetical protein